MNELELIVQETKCSIEDAANYLSAKTMFYRAVFFEQDKIKRYFDEYTQASDRLYNKKVIKISEEGIFINNNLINTDKKDHTHS